MASRKLPAFIQPMLARSGEAFDSDEHVFEIKWDGTRVLAFVEGGSCRLMNRREFDVTWRYPELAVLGGLPAGTVLDGEIVVLREGKPDFGLLLSREQIRAPRKAETAARATPVTYIVFDQLYSAFDPVLDEPLSSRRERLEETAGALDERCLVFSEGVVGGGVAFHRAACERELEGTVAKRLSSRYLPGRRTDAWIKIKRRLSTLCAIIGFVPAGDDDIRSLIVATEEDGELRPAGRVGSGIDSAMRDRLNRLLRERLRSRPIVRCGIRGKWVEPGLYCKVTYSERTGSGEFRAPVFEGLIEE